MSGAQFRSTGAGVVRCLLKSPPLVQGRYCVDVYLQNGLESIDMVEEYAEFQVAPANIYGTGMDPLTSVGNIFLRADWNHLEDGTNKGSKPDPVDSVR